MKLQAMSRQSHLAPKTASLSFPSAPHFHAGWSREGHAAINQLIINTASEKPLKAFLKLNHSQINEATFDMDRHNNGPHHYIDLDPLLLPLDLNPEQSKEERQAKIWRHINKESRDALAQQLQGNPLTQYRLAQLSEEPRANVFNYMLKQYKTLVEQFKALEKPNLNFEAKNKAITDTTKTVGKLLHVAADSAQPQHTTLLHSQQLPMGKSGGKESSHKWFEHLLPTTPNGLQHWEEDALPLINEKLNGKMKTVYTYSQVGDLLAAFLQKAYIAHCDMILTLKGSNRSIREEIEATSSTLPPKPKSKPESKRETKAFKRQEKTEKKQHLAKYQTLLAESWKPIAAKQMNNATLLGAVLLRSAWHEAGKPNLITVDAREQENWFNQKPSSEGTVPYRKLFSQRKK